MTLNEKNKWRLRFKVAAIVQVFAVVAIGGVLAYLGKAEGFGGIAAGSMTFAGMVFGVDYATSPKE